MSSANIASTSRRTMPYNQVSSCPDMEKGFVDIYEQCSCYTMLSVERMYALYSATRYIVKSNIPGDVVECGVWKGGSAMVVMLSLIQLGDVQRTVYLYDTYQGMVEPTEKDIDYSHVTAKQHLAAMGKTRFTDWCCATLDEVRANVFCTAYPPQHIEFVRGSVEETIPSAAPQQISLLHLDTDWYTSTYHELVHLFPRLSVRGVIAIDDYGHWKGSHEAADRYFAENRINILLNRTDYTGRIGIKVGGQ